MLALQTFPLIKLATGPCGIDHAETGVFERARFISDADAPRLNGVAFPGLNAPHKGFTITHIALIGVPTAAWGGKAAVSRNRREGHYAGRCDARHCRTGPGPALKRKPVGWKPPTYIALHFGDPYSAFAGPWTPDDEAPDHAADALKYFLAATMATRCSEAGGV